MGFQDAVPRPPPAHCAPPATGSPGTFTLRPIKPPRPTLTLSQHRHVAEPVTLRISGPERQQLPQGRQEEKLKLPDSHAGETAAAGSAL